MAAFQRTVVGPALQGTVAVTLACILSLTLVVFLAAATLLICTLLAASAALLVSLLVFLAVVCGVLATTGVFITFVVAPLILGSSAIALLAVGALVMMFLDVSTLPFLHDNNAGTESQVGIKAMIDADTESVIKAEKGVNCQCIRVEELNGLDNRNVA